jgi:wyosine [tRNA(Phe)-imidazoG37] synthetase (radical SAM superfamily)
MLAFDPMPSKSLERGLRVNNVPFKTYSYSCVCCQLGRTEKTNAHGEWFYDPEDVVSAVNKGRACCNMPQTRGITKQISEVRGI